MKYRSFAVMILLAVAARAQMTGFVERCGNRLMVNGERYLFNAVTYLSNRWSNDELSAIDDWFQERLVANESNAVRAWIFGHNADSWNFAPNPARGQFDEQDMLRIDRLIATAEKYDARLVFCLGGQWVHSGGIPHLMSWSSDAMDSLKAICLAAANNSALDDASQTGRTDLTAKYQEAYNALQAANTQYEYAEALDPMKLSSYFYENEDCKAIFKEWLHALITRENTLTGRLYKDEPAIMCWELMNEGRNYCWRPECNVWSTMMAARKERILKMRDWYDEMSTYIKENDPNHLVSTGEDGFLNLYPRGDGRENWKEWYGAYYDDLVDPVSQIFSEAIVDSAFNAFGKEAETEWYPLQNGMYDGSDYYMNSMLPNVDLLTIHDQANLVTSGWASHLDARRWRVVKLIELSKDAICKPIYVGESNFPTASEANTYYTMMLEADLDGLVYWEYPDNKEGTGDRVQEFKDYTTANNAKVVSIDNPQTDCACQSVAVKPRFGRNLTQRNPGFTCYVKDGRISVCIGPGSDPSVSVSLLSISGRRIAKSALRKGNMHVFFPLGGSGIYFVSVSSPKGIDVQRVVVGW